MLCCYHLFIALPVFSVWGVSDQIVEGHPSVAVIRECAPEGDAVSVAARGILHEEIRLRHGPRLRVHLLAEQMDLRPRVYGGANDVPILAQADRDVLLRDQ